MNQSLAALLAMTEQIGFALIVIALIMASWDDLSEGLEALREPGIFAVLGGVTVLGLTVFGTYDLGPDFLLLALSISIACIMGMLSTRFALGFLVGVLLLRPWEILPGSDFLSALPRGAAGLALASALFRTRNRSSWVLAWKPEDLALGAFALLSYVSTFVSPHSAEAQEIWTTSFSRSLIVYLLIRLLVIKRQDVRALGFVLGIAGATLVAVTLLRLSADPRLQDVSARAVLFGMIGDPNDLAATLLLALPFFGGALLRGKLPVWLQRLGFLGVVALSVWVIVQTQSRGAFLGLLAAALAFGITRLRSRRGLVYVMAGLLVAGVALFATLRRSESDLSSSSSSRMAYWEAGWRMAIRHPLIGVGFDGYPWRFQEYADASKVESKLRTAHSTWVLALAETGFLGFFFFAFLMLGASWRVWQRRLEEPELFVAFAGYFAAASFLSHTYLLQPYILAALGVCLSVTPEKGHAAPSPS
jgi:putative inorganic carbon (HCO3(-)) transporter